MSHTQASLSGVAAPPPAEVSPEGRRWRVFPRRLAVVIVVIFMTCSIAAIEAYLLVKLRQAAWESAEREARNIARTVSDSIFRTFSMVDLSLLQMKHNFEKFDVFSLPPELSRALLFSGVSELKDIGQSLVLSEYGYLLFSSGTRPPTGVNLSDRDYFIAQKQNTTSGLYLGAPLISRISANAGVALSRRLDAADGSFDGVVVGFLRQSFFEDLFSHVDAPRNAQLLLVRNDGAAIFRWPPDEPGRPTAAGMPEVPQRLLTDPKHEGQFLDNHEAGGTPALYVYHRLRNVPLTMVVVLDQDVILAEWNRQGAILTLLTLVVIVVGMLLTFSLDHALIRRDEVTEKLNKLTRSDPLTGLANRRYFESTLEVEWGEARERRRPLSLLMIDVDHFKSVNDTYGHDCGDNLLKAIAAAIATAVRRPRDLAVRFGGEEFIALLPETDARQALVVAENIRSQVAATTVQSPSGESVSRTVSIGVSTMIPDGSMMSPLITEADEQMYRAKAAGRNTIRGA